MKQKILLSTIALLLTIQGFSQVKPFRFGVRVAPNLAWLAPDSKDYTNDGTMPGFSWGFLADISLTENYFVKTGFNIDYLNGKLLYPHQQLVNEEDPFLTTGQLSRKYNLRYLEIPLTLKMRTNTFNKTAFFGEIGFGTSLNLKAKSKDEFMPDESQNALTSVEDIKDEVAFVKASMIAGAGIEYFIDESTSIITTLSFNNGLTNLLKGNNSIDESIKQRATLYYFQLTVGIMF